MRQIADSIVTFGFTNPVLIDAKGTIPAFLSRALSNLAAASLDRAIHFVCMDWCHLAEIIEAGEQIYAELKNLIVWVKDSGGMGTFYRSRHELIFAFKVGTAPHVNAFELVSTDATAPTCCSTAASTPGGPAGWTSFKCTPPSSRSR